MSKKIQSCIVILVTIFCALIMIFSDQINDKTNSIKNKILVITEKNINSAKQINNSQQNKNMKNDDSTSEKNRANNNTTTKDNIKNSVVMSEKYKKFKMERMNDELVQDKERFFSKDNTKDNVDKQSTSVETKQNLVKQSKDQDLVNQDNKKVVDDKRESLKEEVPVFKVSRSKINDSLTLADKTKLLSIASKLSAVDYEKVRKYLQSGSDQDIKNTVKLLKERLSEKDYDNAKEVAKKIINMDAVEQ